MVVLMMILTVMRVSIIHPRYVRGGVIMDVRVTTMGMIGEDKNTRLVFFVMLDVQPLPVALPSPTHISQAVGP
jgi:hypothetical protein